MSGRMPIGCAVLAATLSIGTPARADVVTDWNTIAVNTTNAANRPAPAWLLDVVMVHIAMHDAVQAYQHRFETYNEPIQGASGSIVVAAARAARDVLVHRFPAEAGTINTTYETYVLSKGFLLSDAGVSIGQEAALRIIVRRANDGSYPLNPEVFTGNNAAGQWRPTQPAFNVPMAAPWMGQVEPFAIERDDLLPEPPPPDLSSDEYAIAYNEVKAVGRRTNSTRTAAQTEMAMFYSGNFLTIMSRVLRDVAAARADDIGGSARLFALAYIAASDTAISTWRNKRHFNFWRPSTAIVNGAADGNPNTDPDASWLPLVNDPPYPDYTSGANGLTGAIIRTLWRYFGDKVSFTAFTTVANIPPRTFTRLSEMADEVVEARILLGIHFRFADVVARRQGFQSADWAFSHVLRPTK
jgi:hypothetical protein